MSGGSHLAVLLAGLSVFSAALRLLRLSWPQLASIPGSSSMLGDLRPLPGDVIEASESDSQSTDLQYPPDHGIIERLLILHHGS